MWVFPWGFLLVFLLLFFFMALFQGYFLLWNIWFVNSAFVERFGVCILFCVILAIMTFWRVSFSPPAFWGWRVRLAFFWWMNLIFICFAIVILDDILGFRLISCRAWIWSLLYEDSFSQVCFRWYCVFLDFCLQRLQCKSMSSRYGFLGLFHAQMTNPESGQASLQGIHLRNSIRVINAASISSKCVCPPCPFCLTTF